MVIAIPTVRRPQRRPNTLRRHRLLDLIHQNIHRKLTFLCAPAGYGKTTLLADFCEDANSRIAWCQVGAADKDLAHFFRHLVLALHQTYPGFGADLEGASIRAAASSPQALAVELVNEMIAWVDDFTLLILDDYHVISEDLPIVSFVEHVLELLPENLRMVIGSRSVYGIPSSSLYVNEELAVLSAHDLRFRAGEVRDLARQYFRIHLTQEQAEEIAVQSDGWITSILLSFQDGAPSAAIPRLAGARDQVYEYLAREVYARLPADTRRFLLCTAACDEFDIPLANYVLEMEDAAEIIRQLENQNLFISPVPESPGNKYQYHQLFRDFLLAQFKEEPASEQVLIHSRIAAWYEQQGEPVPAVAHYLQAGDREGAARVMDQYARPLYIDGQENMLNDWFRATVHPARPETARPRPGAELCEDQGQPGKTGGLPGIARPGRTGVRRPGGIRSRGEPDGGAGHDPAFPIPIRGCSRNRQARHGTGG